MLKICFKSIYPKTILAKNQKYKPSAWYSLCQPAVGGGDTRCPTVASGKQLYTDLTGKMTAVDLRMPAYDENEPDNERQQRRQVNVPVWAEEQSDVERFVKIYVLKMKIRK